MNDTALETQQEWIPPRQKSDKNPRKEKGIIGWLVISLLVWGSLVYGGYFLANQYIKESKAYIDTTIEQMETQNKEQIEIIKELQTKFDQVYSELLNIKSELAFIQEDLALTGETLNGTDKTKQALQQRIDQLNKQLNELQASIQRLEDAAK